MNPYLENPDLWSEVHHRLISAIASSIFPHLPPTYRVAIEKRVYTQVPEDSILVGIPDVSVLSQRPTSMPTAAPTLTLPQTTEQSLTVTLPIPEEIREGYLEIRDMATGAVITAIEVLSPTNKRAGKGRNAYLSKRETILGSTTHLVEIDLLRESTPMPIIENLPRSHYRILISCSEQRPKGSLFSFNLPQSIPVIKIPLRPADIPPELNLQTLLEDLYEEARYDLAIDYNIDPIPALSESDRAWCQAILRDSGRLSS